MLKGQKRIDKVRGRFEKDIEELNRGIEELEHQKEQCDIEIGRLEEQISVHEHMKDFADASIGAAKKLKTSLGEMVGLSAV